MRSAVEIVIQLAEKAKAKRANAQELADNSVNSAELEKSDIGNQASLAGKRGLLPVHHPNRDFFLCDLFDYALKDDGVSMEAPIFTLATKPDLSVWHWESKDGSRAVTVTPSVLGRATQFDKDLLIYVVSQMTEALNRGRLDANSRTVRFRVYDYLISTNKLTGGKEYQRLQDALERLRGTSIKTNIKTGGQRVKEGFGILDSWMIIEKSPNDDRMIAVEVNLSKWLFNAVQAHEVLTINPDYFRLRKPIERRLYELARKHCGNQSHFVIGVALLQEKCGSKSNIREFRRSLREIIQADTLPDYRIKLDNKKDQVIFYSRDMLKLVQSSAVEKNIF
jgi:plasmid replication initiation protein